MTALTANRVTAERSGVRSHLLVAAAAKLYGGGMAAMDADGHMVNPVSEDAILIVGKNEAYVDNTDGADGDLVAEYSQGVFCFSNSDGADEITASDKGKLCFAVDDQTVALTDNAGARLRAGIIDSVDEAGVWVRFGDTGNHVAITIPAVALDGTTPKTAVAPVSGRVTRIVTVISGALTTGDATVTAAIGDDAITGGVVTITQAASATGDVDMAVPTAANFVAAGALLKATPGGTNDAVRTADVTFLIEV